MTSQGIIDRRILNWIACISMIIDHIGALFYPNNVLMRVIGRAAFIIYADGIAGGYLKTRNIRKYAMRLLALALVTEIPYNLAFYGFCWPGSGVHNNVFTLLLGLICIYAVDHFNAYLKTKEPGIGNRARHFMVFLSTIPFQAIAYALRLNYGYYGILIILIMYIFKIKPYPKEILYMLVGVLSCLCFPAADGVRIPVQVFCLFGLILVSLKKDENCKLSTWETWLHYSAYPLHLLIMYLIKIF